MITNFFGLLKALENKNTVRLLLAECNLLHLGNQLCSKCLEGRKRIRKNSRTPLGCHLVCSNKNCRNESRILISMWLKNKCIKKLLIVLGAFITKKSISSIIIDSGLDEKTVYSYFAHFRQRIFEEYNAEEIKLGNELNPVEIDETHLFTRKYHRGSILASEQIWVFGIMERNSKKVYLKSCVIRDASTLFSIVSNHVNPGTIVYSDCWCGYSTIRRHFEVYSVNHRLHFVDPENPNVHTQNIERLWRTLKEGMRGVSNENYDLHLNEFMFRRNVLTGNFHDDLVLLLRLILL